MSAKIMKRIKVNKGYYLPLANKQGLVGSITPFLSGDLKKGYYHYALEPISELGLFDLSTTRNIIFYINNERYDLNGNRDVQQSDEVKLEVDQLTQKVSRRNSVIELVTKSFVAVGENVEIHHINLKNISNESISVSAIATVPLYSRSPENIHDHRHVTSLLNVVNVVENGIINNPTLTFDERGHKLNKKIYSLHAFSNKTKISNYIPTIDEYLNGGSFNYPKGLSSSKYKVGDVVKGFEAMGAMRFEKFILGKDEDVNFSMIIGISDDEKELKQTIDKYKDFKAITEEYINVQNFYRGINDYINFKIENEDRTNQFKWITLQPILRRHLGNSYLPHHDYGHGGRGWRDLWQDLLSLIYSSDNTVRENIISYFAGVRIDGSNATIIGDKPGEFKADRNQIVRVWSDHAAWPLLTVKLYIDETGEIEIINEKQKYFNDGLTHYSRNRMNKTDDYNYLRVNEEVYEGTLLEHLLLQNLVGYFNVGKHGFTRLEDADWNDGLDMGSECGETIPFTMFYLNNLKVIVEILKELKTNKVELFDSLNKLLNEEMNITKYFDAVSINEGLDKVEVDKDIILNKLNELILRKENHIYNKAVIKDGHYQSYIDNDGKPLDTEKTMSLTVHAMALLNNIPSEKFANKIAHNVKEMLFDENIGGYRLNSNYEKILTSIGRAYGFAYGHKENGAVFCHMATMYAYGLYNYNLVTFGNEAVTTLLNQALKVESGVLAGVPEYFNEEGRGKYLFLTGTASWLIKLYREQIFGINMSFGKLTFNPKLSKSDFLNGEVEIETFIKNEKINIKYINKKVLDFGEYKVSKIYINGKETKQREFENIGEKVEVFLDEIN